MGYPHSPSNTDSADFYAIGQVSIEGDFVVDNIDSAGNKRHKWNSEVNVSLSTSPPVQLMTDAFGNPQAWVTPA